MEQFIDSINLFCPCESVNGCLVLISLCSPVKQQTVQRWTQPWWLSSFPRWSSPRFRLTIKCKILAPPSSALMAFCSSSRRSVSQASRKRKGSVTDRQTLQDPELLCWTSWHPVTYIMKTCYLWLLHWHPITHSYPMYRNTVMHGCLTHSDILLHMIIQVT